jgi:hypothetical protein
MAKIDHISVTLSVRLRWWFKPAFVLLYLACAAIDLVSNAAAQRASEVGTTWLARHGVWYIAE